MYDLGVPELMATLALQEGDISGGKLAQSKFLLRPHHFTKEAQSVQNLLWNVCEGINLVIEVMVKHVGVAEINTYQTDATFEEVGRGGVDHQTWQGDSSRSLK
ncbi:hypothetical protein MBM_03717 [Drepanopeziza brunnea f. sp. 'multigermtubi' MB_m1]|uniref:Uncharacterized protein n=1 Tax=Marssonina brunnea f. sp. multigermtubi (strain MB_m1) TaxID=1072389 RepID=K1WJS0_MARBU|nr:uncharacterized protein MBM_03717 [Drepanopeziza brunnea f. sp. 'multigermtubi' MB_m1]EKD17945.1 hypothetical protein MBM_03717 [Drepanopeziza brunnea f. sp. 'multigermtubi' MB_m1]